MVYGCDAAWWLYRRGLKEFKGHRVCWEGGFQDRAGFLSVRIGTTGGKGAKYTDDLLLGDPGLVGGGGNSGFQALNIALNLGARKIVLIGFDMSSRSGVHWYGRNSWPMANNPDDTNFRRWIAAFTRAAPVIRSMGASVVNASPNSALQCFPKMTIAQAMQELS